MASFGLPPESVTTPSYAATTGWSSCRAAGSAPRNPDQVERELNKPLGQRTEGQMRPTQGPVDRTNKETAHFEVKEPWP